MRLRMRVLLALAISAGFLGVVQADVVGPIKVSPNGRYFVDRNGKPFFWLADTAWPLLARYSKSQAEGYLKNRAAKGFTVIQCVATWPWVGSYEDTPNVPPSSDDPQPNVFGQSPWHNNNPATPNEDYFKHVDYLVEFANRKGLVLAILPTWGQFVNETRVLNLKNARAYGRWLGKRYKDSSNIVWINGGDRVPLGFEEVYRELARGLREGDGGAHLITYHPCGWHSSSQFFHHEDWLDFNMIQTWTEWAKIHPSVSADLVLTPVKPVVLGEPAYEDGPEYPMGPITPLIVRRQAWWAVTAGGFFTYGQNQMWRMGKDWEKSFDTPGAAHVAKMKEIVTARRWWELVPDQAMFAEGVSSGRTLNTALRSVKGDFALVYLSSPCRVFIQLHRILTRNVKATWVNPATGEEKDAGSYLTGQLDNQIFPSWEVQHFKTPDFWEDAVLMLEGF